MKATKKVAPVKLSVPVREKLAALTHDQLVKFRDALRGQPKTVAGKAYRRAVRRLERATRKDAPKAAKKGPSKEGLRSRGRPEQSRRVRARRSHRPPFAPFYRFKDS